MKVKKIGRKRILLTHQGLDMVRTLGHYRGAKPCLWCEEEVEMAYTGKSVYDRFPPLCERCADEIAGK